MNIEDQDFEALGAESIALGGSGYGGDLRFAQSGPLSTDHNFILFTSGNILGSHRIATTGAVLVLDGIVEIPPVEPDPLQNVFAQPLLAEFMPATLRDSMESGGAGQGRSADSGDGSQSGLDDPEISTRRVEADNSLVCT